MGIRLAWLIVFLSVPALAEDLSVLEKPQPQMLRDALRYKVHAALDARRNAYEARTDPAAIAVWQRELRAKFIESLGGFPDRTPLNAKVVGKIDGDGYRVEKVIYESRPQFFVTAVLYLPKTKAPYPAVLLPCGHTENGKAAAVYQKPGILLAKHGIAVLCYDPVGQGERKQILNTNPQGEPLPSGQFKASSEHSLTGVAPILLGECLASYRIWDGIRSLDYLASRPDLDAKRLGCMGNSGGGLMTSYLVALDDRIKAAAPGCFVTTTRIKNERPGPGDAEQNLFAQTAYGLDHADYLMLAAPRAVLICSATQDFVPIEGAWISYRQAKRLYTRLGFSERVDLVETDAKHGFSKELRVAVLRWMRRWLLNVDDPATEEEFEVHPVKDFQCTPQGQVLLMDSARSLNDVYKEFADQLANHRTKWYQNISEKDRIAIICKLASCKDWKHLPAHAVRGFPSEKNQISRKNYKIHKLILEPVEGHIKLPVLLFLPDQPKNLVTIYVHGEGKHVEAKPGGEIERLVQQGNSVFAVDLRGYGETESAAWRFSKTYSGANAAEYFISYMLGQSLVGSRAEDIIGTAKYALMQFPNAKLHLMANGRAGIPALHAAAISPGKFESVAIDQSLDSWHRVIETPVTMDQLENTIHGALKFYDLPDLIKLIGKDKVTLTQPTDAKNQSITGERGALVP